MKQYVSDMTQVGRNEVDGPALAPPRHDASSVISRVGCSFGRCAHQSLQSFVRIQRLAEGGDLYVV